MGMTIRGNIVIIWERTPRRMEDSQVETRRYRPHRRSRISPGHSYKMKSLIGARAPCWSFRMTLLALRQYLNWNYPLFPWAGKVSVERSCLRRPQAFEQVKW